MKLPLHKLIFLIALAAVMFLSACKSSGGLIGPADETVEAGEIVKEANADLTEIAKLYNANESKRDELKKAMEAGNAEEVRRICRDVVDAINEGASLGKSALDKIDKAREMNINEDYSEYLRLKWEALNKQLEAFEQYRQAARKLRDEYDPKDTQARSIVEAEFKQRNDNYIKLTEKARDYSSQARELAKEVTQRELEK